MWRTAVIGGRVTDDNGDPLIGAEVRAMRQQYVAGRPHYDTPIRARTDDRGVYRFSTLIPGDYLVAAVSTKVSVAQIDAPEAELAGGAELRLSTSMALIAGVSISLMLPVDSEPSAFSPSASIDCTGAGFDLAVPACETARHGLATPTAAGSYGRLTGQLSLGFTYDWW